MRTKHVLTILITAIMVIGLIPFAAFAADGEPVEYKPSGTITITGGNYITSSGNYTVKQLTLYARSTLTIGKDAKITVSRSVENMGTLNILGTLDVANCSEAFNIGTIHVSCSGTIKGNISNMNGTVVYDKHIWKDGVCTVCGVRGCEIGELEHVWENGVCTVCGVMGCKIGKLGHVWENGVCTVCGVKGCEVGEFEHAWKDGVCTFCGHECTNEFHNGIHVCPDCGMELNPTQGNPLSSASVLSEGNQTIVVGVAAAVIFGFSGFLLGRKKKPMPANAVGNDEE